MCWGECSRSVSQLKTSWVGKLTSAIAIIILLCPIWKIIIYHKTYVISLSLTDTCEVEFGLSCGKPSFWAMGKLLPLLCFKRTFRDLRFNNYAWEREVNINFMLIAGEQLYTLFRGAATLRDCWLGSVCSWEGGGLEPPSPDDEDKSVVLEPSLLPSEGSWSFKWPVCSLSGLYRGNTTCCSEGWFHIIGEKSLWLLMWICFLVYLHFT